MKYKLTFEQAVGIFEMMGFTREFFGRAGYVMVQKDHGIVLDIAEGDHSTFHVRPVEGESFLPRIHGETDLQYIERMFECSMLQVSS